MILQSQRVWIDQQWIPAQVILEQGQITAIQPYNTQTPDLDVGTHRLLPGFIDVHCHGALAFDTNDPDPIGLQRWAAYYPSEGVTGFCPTTITQSEAVLTTALKNVDATVNQGLNGAQVLGVHFEGPYLAIPYKGAQPEPHIVTPDPEQFDRFQTASGQRIKVMTMAVEQDPHYRLTRHATAQGVHVNIGHSGATYLESLMAIANGAGGFTHTFNGMKAFGHREPGTAGAALQSYGGIAEIITDGIHVSWPAVNLLYRAKGPYQVVMITDALQAKGIGEGHYVFGGQAIEIKANGGAYLEGQPNLAGSTLRFNQGLRNVIELAGVDERSAINSATLNPATVLKLAHRKGKIQAGYDADLVIVDDTYTVLKTWVNGQLVYEKTPSTQP